METLIVEADALKNRLDIAWGSASGEAIRTGKWERPTRLCELARRAAERYNRRVWKSWKGLR
jgi:hypothetical protein